MNLQELVSKVLYKQAQSTFCYCPNCNNELCGSDSFVSDNRNGVTYKCSLCHCKSLWDFDIFPAPYLKKYQRFERKMTPKKEVR